MTFLAVATAVLDVAKATVPHVTRTYLAGGPDVAKVCTQLVAYPGLSRVQGAGDIGQVGPAGCAVAAVPQVVVAYSKDCYPMVGQGGGIGAQPSLPTPAEVTAWTTDYLADCWAIFDGLLEAKYTGLLGSCDLVQINQAEHRGPTGGVCTMLVAVAVGP